MQKKLVAPFMNMNKRERYFTFTMFFIIAVMVALAVINPAFAATSYVTRIRSIMSNMVTIVGVIFQAVGAILSIYAVGQLILAFKNEDANSKSSASTLLVVGIVLIAIPGIITTLNLVNLIGA